MEVFMENKGIKRLYVNNVWGKVRVAAGRFIEKTQEPTHELMALFQRACKQLFGGFLFNYMVKDLY